MSVMTLRLASAFVPLVLAVVLDGCARSDTTDTGSSVPSIAVEDDDTTEPDRFEVVGFVVIEGRDAVVCDGGCRPPDHQGKHGQRRETRRPPPPRHSVVLGQREEQRRRPYPIAGQWLLDTRRNPPWRRHEQGG